MCDLLMVIRRNVNITLIIVNSIRNTLSYYVTIGHRDIHFLKPRRQEILPRNPMFRRSGRISSIGHLISSTELKGFTENADENIH